MPAPSGAKSLEYTVLGLTNGDYTVEPWTPVDSLAWLKAMAWDLRGNMESEIGRAVLFAHGLTREQIDQLYPATRTTATSRSSPAARSSTARSTPAPTDARHGETAARLDATLAPALGRRCRTAMDRLPQLMGDGGPGIGSNSWVIGGAHTTTGKPLLANDPHLSPSMPGIWYQMGLHCDVRVQCRGLHLLRRARRRHRAQRPHRVGLHQPRPRRHRPVPGEGRRRPGLRRHDVEAADHPGRDHQGRRRPAGDHHRAVDQARPAALRPLPGPAHDGARPRSTRPARPCRGGAGADAHAGPARPASRPRRRSRTPSRCAGRRWTPGSTIEALFAAEQGDRTGPTFRAAAALFEVPAQNIVYADVDGNIGYQSPGRIPVRGKGDGTLAGAGLGPGLRLDRLHPASTQLPTVLQPAPRATSSPPTRPWSGRSTRTCSPRTGRTATAASASWT